MYGSEKNRTSRTVAFKALIRLKDGLVSTPLRFRVLLLILLLSCLTQTAYFQSGDLFEVKRLTVDVKHRFNLNSRDVKAIERLIDQQNRSLIRIYARFGGGEPEYSSRLWVQMVDDRVAFEAGIDPTLTTRQREALRSARARMERRILESLVRDYVGFLSQILELDDLESDDVADLFEADTQQKCRLLSQHSSNPSALQKEMEDLTHETDRKLRRSLSDEHWKLYRELIETPKAIA